MISDESSLDHTPTGQQPYEYVIAIARSNTES